MPDQKKKEDFDNDITQNSNQAPKTPTNNDEKTEDDVENEMKHLLRCDGACNRILEVIVMKEMECIHSFCAQCLLAIDENNHTVIACPTKKKELGLIRKVEKSASDVACHEGSLSKASPINDNGEGGSKLEGSSSIRNAKKEQVKEEKKKSSPRKNVKRQKSWYSFTYKNKPLAVSMPKDATYGDLLKRIATYLEVSLRSHVIEFKIPPSSSDSSKEHHNAEVTTLGRFPSKTKLIDLKLPKSKMIIIDVRSKNKRPRSKSKEDVLDTSRTQSDTELDRTNRE